MGNEASVFNETGKPLTMHTFNNFDTIYKVCAAQYRLPTTGGQAVPISGMAGGGAVKAAILYENKKEESFAYDIFRVKNGGSLHLKEMCEDDGITDFSGDAVLVQKGLVVKPLNVKADDMSQGLKVATKLTKIAHNVSSTVQSANS